MPPNIEAEHPERRIILGGSKVEATSPKWQCLTCGHAWGRALPDCEEPSFNHPLWVHLYVHTLEDAWAAMLAPDDVLPPEPGQLKGLAVFAETSDAAEPHGTFLLDSVF